MELKLLGDLCIGGVSMVAILVRVCVLCSIWLPGHGLLGGSLNDGG